MKLSGKTAVVTGASTGIGRAIAIELANEGANVAVVSRRRDELEKTKELVSKADGKRNVEVFVADLTDIRDIERFTNQVVKWKEKVAILINAADVWHINNKPYFETSLDLIPVELISQSLDIGLKAAILLARAFVPKMNGWGRVVSMSGSFSPKEKGCLPQYVTKKGVEMFTKQLALEYKSQGVTANALSPWYVWTEAVQRFWPDLEKQSMKPQEVAKFAVYLCSEEAKNITGKVWSLKKGEKPIGKTI